jgi:hypothetical protein
VNQFYFLSLSLCILLSGPRSAAFPKILVLCNLTRAYLLAQQAEVSHRLLNKYVLQPPSVNKQRSFPTGVAALFI